MVSEATIFFISGPAYVVLILVVMEDGLREGWQALQKVPTLSVLILVVMEDGLRDSAEQGLSSTVTKGLNPCCYGRWSQSQAKHGKTSRLRTCLNPCCYGRWSQSMDYHTININVEVLILVVMEDGLRVEFNDSFPAIISLNPCCYGRWSQSETENGVSYRVELS